MLILNMASLAIMLASERITKALIRLRVSACWSASLLFARNKSQVVSRQMNNKSFQFDDKKWWISSDINGSLISFFTLIIVSKRVCFGHWSLVIRNVVCAITLLDKLNV